MGGYLLSNTGIAELSRVFITPYILYFNVNASMHVLGITRASTSIENLMEELTIYIPSYPFYNTL